MNPIRPFSRTDLVVTFVAAGIGFAIGLTAAYRVGLWLLGGFK